MRGVEVMLDSDLARLYECKNGTKEVNQAVKNNIDKFPKRYSFQLTDDECKYLWSKFLTANISSKSRSNPRVFTEQGVYMLATILKGKKASQMTLQIMDAFVLMKRYISEGLINSRILVNHEERILKLEESFNKFSSKEKTIIYEGKIYDAFSVLIDMFNEAKIEIIIIDNYANKDLLDMLRNINKKIIIISKNIDELLIKKYKSQYQNIEFINTNPFHDRYIILDRSIVYSSGMSLKDVGKSYSYINKEKEEIFIRELLKRLNDMLC
ncbi:MAG: ORF6N domain-containing protein [Bacilli bacterium]